ncbi:uncharacterized protein LOC117679707 [Pantherophis guttatus]|uniref:Uncharacterized protein LOC117679707 n=1 Tax=Pantherophis guttatus TaxID=94885 RepID=A0ABM3YWA7_PANGU|nr:uncharacterized protein LOC117679707 [Pantherophis guttatus]
MAEVAREPGTFLPKETVQTAASRAAKIRGDGEWAQVCALESPSCMFPLGRNPGGRAKCQRSGAGPARILSTGKREPGTWPRLLEDSHRSQAGLPCRQTETELVNDRTRDCPSVALHADGRKPGAAVPEALCHAASLCANGPQEKTLPSDFQVTDLQISQRLSTANSRRGVLERVFSSCHTSTQRKPRTCSRVAPGTHSSTGPFEFGSSIRPGDRRAHLNSANFTASQGPGLDSDFGASAGVSVRILSTDSEGSPNTPVVHRQQAEHFEWDYYDPSYKRKAQLHHSLPPICSKQYWL